MQCTAPKPAQSKPRVHVHRAFNGVMDSIREARSWTTNTLNAHSVEPPEWLELLVSELTTNAVIHTRSGSDGSFTLRITASSASIRVEVHDAGPLPGRTPTRMWALPEATHGRGLALVDTFANRWGTLTHGVWAEVAR